MDFNEVLEKLEDNSELAKSLEEAIGRGADVAEFRGILDDAGVDAESAEVAVAEYQRRRGLTIADEDLDEEMLIQVAGGGCGKCTEAADCDKTFKDSDKWNLERCSLFEYCDEMQC